MLKDAAVIFLVVLALQFAERVLIELQRSAAEQAAKRDASKPLT